ncbi:NFX1-type zinc finger-containing protein 1 homolog isoform X3 [Rhagoletis pomonella]|uniref:NFX1-type zinc finger-containing protein 1 homolog isoform X3 n=1 Tax=Rhagoletis pomonella TaxID=28610 RepID=UPI00177DF502|nr:NFX1-type zinc finger-containing protein 1 homolog isoform X3 [Rhagoletis pomonella]
MLTRNVCRVVMCASLSVMLTKTRNISRYIYYKCYRDCDRIYDNCVENHTCKKQCFEECGLCPKIVAKTRSCGHHFKPFVFSKNVEEIECDRPCKRKLSCGHKFPSKWCEPCGSCPFSMSSCNHMVEVKSSAV